MCLVLMLPSCTCMYLNIFVYINKQKNWFLHEAKLEKTINNLERGKA